MFVFVYVGLYANVNKFFQIGNKNLTKMNKYFNSFVESHGGDSEFSKRIGITRQSVGNLKRGRNKATEKVIKAIEESFPDFERAKYFSADSVEEYTREIEALKMKNAELEMKVKVMEESQKALLSEILNYKMGKYNGGHKSLLIDNIEALINIQSPITKGMFGAN